MTKYIPCTEDQIPFNVRFDTPGRHQGQTVEVSYATAHRSAGEADEGDEYKRVTDQSVGIGDPDRVKYYRLSDLAPSATRYAVVPSHGRYGSGDPVRALSVHDDLRVALKRAAAATRSFQDVMRHYGGTSGGYRVIATEATPHDAVWLGCDLDRIPSVRS